MSHPLRSGISAFVILVAVTSATSLVAGDTDDYQSQGSGDRVSNDYGPVFWKLPFHTMIRLYQVTFGMAKQSTCPMEPSCSRYGIEAVRKHSTPIAILMTGDRLHRCGHDLHYYQTALMESGLEYLDPVPCPSPHVNENSIQGPTRPQ